MNIFPYDCLAFLVIFFGCLHTLINPNPILGNDAAAAGAFFFAIINDDAVNTFVNIMSSLF